MITFGQGLGEYPFAKGKEYLLTSSTGYCSQSLAGNTRKYHALLAQEGRISLSTLDEYLNKTQISIASYGGTLQEKGLKYLRGFSCYPPRFFYEVDGTFLQKTILFDGTVRIQYDMVGDGALRVLPLVTDRSIHETKKDLDLPVQVNGQSVVMDHLILTSEGMQFSHRPDTYYNVWYEEDHARGFEHQEDLFTPGSFLAEGADLTMTISGRMPAYPAEKRPRKEEPFTPLQYLHRAAEDFIHGERLIAGYHWFLESWGRDAFVSLPGLLLERGKFREAEKVFRFFGRQVRGGLVPNRVPGEYNSSDASLWFLHALRQYWESRGENAFMGEMRTVAEAIFSSYGESGVAHLDGALIAVAPRSTWMDTQFTPRQGKPVEINALWVRSLEFAEELGLDPPLKPGTARKAFERFWNPAQGSLYDCIDPFDASVRPNQVIALALGLVSGAKGVQVLETVRRHLLTPYGLRTLSPGEEGYVGRFTGDPSYHNGCAWPWLTGYYIEGAIRMGVDPERLRLLLAPLFLHLQDAGLGTVSECFEGDPPYCPRGCIAQAWSVGELIRAHQLIKRASDRLAKSEGGIQKLRP
jgi:glycogen debranching enzyme